MTVCRSLCSTPNTFCGGYCPAPSFQVACPACPEIAEGRLSKGLRRTESLGARNLHAEAALAIAEGDSTIRADASRPTLARNDVSREA